MTILEHVAESQVDSWRGLTDSRRPRARRIQLSEQSAPVPFLTAPRTSIPPARPDICPQSSGGVLLEWQQTGRVLTVDLDGVEGFSFAYESPGVESEGGIEDFVSLLRAGLQPF